MSDCDSNNSSLKILMITCFPFFSFRGTPIATKSRLEVLSSLGHRVDVLAYHVGENVVIPGVRIFRIINIPFIKEVPAGPSSKKFFLDILVFLKAVHSLIINRYDLILTHEEAGYFGVLLSRIFKVKHIYNFHASLPQAMKNFGYAKYKPLISILEFLEKRVVNSSQGLISISPELDAYISRINDKIPRVLIEDSQNYDFKNIDKVRSDSFKLSKPDLDGRNIVWYGGTFELYQGLDLLLASAELVIKERDDTVFVLAGGREEQIEALKKSAERRGIASHVQFIGSGIPMEEIALYMSISTILVSTRITGDNPPSKIYDYLRAGKPIVATNINAHTQILNEDISVLVNPSPESVASGILSILDNPSYAENLAQRTREYFDKNYSMKKKVEKTKKILDEVMKEDI